MSIEEKHVIEVCKLGQGHDCCRYLGADSKGFCCLKFSHAIDAPETKKDFYCKFFERRE